MTHFLGWIFAPSLTCDLHTQSDTKRAFGENDELQYEKKEKNIPPMAKKGLRGPRSGRIPTKKVSLGPREQGMGNSARGICQARAQRDERRSKNRPTGGNDISTRGNKNSTQGIGLQGLFSELARKGETITEGLL